MEEPSQFQQSIMLQGTEVGKLARDLFTKGVLIDEDYKNIDGALRHTQEVMKSKVDAIFEGAFVYDNVLVRADILKRNNDGSFDLIEVKSSTSIKPEHLPDCAVQAYVLINSGLKIKNVCLMYLNNKYVKSGSYDLNELFIISPINDKIIDELNNVPVYLNRIKQTLESNHEPQWNIGTICKNPYPCEFKKYCWSEVPEKSIHSISRVSDKMRETLLNMNVTLIKDVPDNYKLSTLQTIQVKCEKEGCRQIDAAAISEYLDELEYPLYFLDFETVGYALPKYDGTRPYQHLPFQYSIHIKNDPNSELIHKEYIFDKDENPSRSVAENLVKDIGKSGSIVTYHASFEGSKILELSRQFVDLADMLTAIQKRLWDLETPFEKKWFYDSGFDGGSSIKKVLPTLVPSMNYDDLEIQKGDIALLNYQQMIAMQCDDPNRNTIKNSLLKYCSLDTLAMVYILDKLSEVIKN